jgi:hypothetical protein
MPEQTNYQAFDEKAINDAIASVKAQPDPSGAAAAPVAAAAAAAPAKLKLPDSGQLFLAAQCISVTVNNKQICLNLPLGIGKVCLPVPSWVPNGTAAEACIGICTTWKVPTGVKLTVTVAGKVIIQKTWGKC